MTHNPPLPQFMKFEYPIYNFKVVEKRDCCKLHIIKGKLQNDMGFVPFTFKINVINKPPFFSKNQLENQQVAVGYIKSYSLPKVIDEDQIFVKCFAKEQNKASLPSFVDFNEK